MRAKGTKEGQEDPRDRVIIRPSLILAVSGAVHAWNQKEIDQPTDSKQAQREEPNDSGDLPAVIETVRARETKDPEYVTDDFAVCFVLHGIDKMLRNRPLASLDGNRLAAMTKKVDFWINLREARGNEGFVCGRALIQ